MKLLIPSRDEKKRVLWLIVILTIVTSSTLCIAGYMLYKTAIAEERERLVEAAQSQARLMEAVARFDSAYSSDYPEGSQAATLSQIIDAHSQYMGFGETGEFTLARREGNTIVFLLSHRHFDLEHPRPVPLSSELAEPMRRALSGQSGTVIGLDYRGELVLAAYEPVRELDLGIVAKIDLAEVRLPFIRAGLVSAGAALVAIVLGAWMFVRITNPMIQRQRERTVEAEKLNIQMEREIGERRQAELLLREERDKARRYLDIAGTIIVVIDVDEKVSLINRKGCEILGYDEDEILGKDWFETFLPASDRSRVKAVFRMLMAGEIAGGDRYENPVMKKGGEQRLIAWHNSLLKDENGKIIATLSSGEDITERKEAQHALQKSEERWRSLVEWAPNHIMILDRDFTIQFINHPPAGILPEEFIGASAIDFVEPEFREVAKETIEQVFETGQGGVYTVTAPGPYRKVAWYENHVGPLMLTGKVVAVTVISSDITERKNAEAALEWESRVNCVLAELAKALVGPSQPIDVISDLVLGQARGITGSDHGFVSSMDPKTRKNIVHTFSGIMENCAVPQEQKKTVLGMGEDGRYPALWGHTLNTKEAFYTDNPSAHEASIGAPEGHISLNGFLTVPVMIGDDLLGQIALANPKSTYTEKDLEAIERVGDLYALALQRHWVRQELLKHQHQLEDLVEKRTRHLETEISQRKQTERELQNLSGRLISAQEEERSRISRELHDDLNQKLALLAVRLQQLGQKPARAAASLRKEVRDLWSLTRELSSDVHSLSQRLHPSQLEHVGLARALRRLCRDFSKQSNMEISFKHGQVPRSVPQEIFLCLYRIAQEALHNVVRHSGATEAEAELTADAGSIRLMVKDAGNGFDPDAAKAKGGLGLANMRERVRLASGQLTMLSRPEQGTRIEARVPLKASEGQVS